jgi:hypothetical protein
MYLLINKIDLCAQKVLDFIINYIPKSNIINEIFTINNYY